MAFVAGAVLLSAAWMVGGWYWALVYLPTVLQQSRVSRDWHRLVRVVGPGLVWIVLFAAVQDRRLYFPFTMFSAVLFAQLWKGGFAAGVAIIVGLFVMVRIEHAASLGVLAVELAVAIVAAALGWWCVRFGMLAAAFAASAVALIGLLL